MNRHRKYAYPEPIPEHEIASLRRMVKGAKETGRRPEPADYLAPGEEVRVAEGPFEGLEGCCWRSGPAAGWR